MKTREIQTIDLKAGGTISVDKLNNHITLNDVKLNGHLFKLFITSEPTQWENILLKVVEIGAITVYQNVNTYDAGEVISRMTEQRAAELNKAVDTTAKKIEEMPKRVQELINAEIAKAFDFKQNGTPLKTVLDQLKDDMSKTFGNDSDIVKKFDTSVNLVFNTEDPKSALFKVNQTVKDAVATANAALVKDGVELKAKLDEMNKAIASLQTFKQMFSKSTQKGTALEQEFEAEKLHPLVDIHGDSYKSVGTKTGKKSRKTGDFLITVENTQGKSIGIEYKADESYSDDDVREEVKLMKENRGTSFDVFVFDEEKYLPTGCGQLSFKDGYIVCTRESFDFAYRAARTIVKAKTGNTAEGIDTKKLEEEVQKLLNKKKAVEGIQKLMSEASKKSNNANGLLNDLWTELEQGFMRILSMVEG